MTTQQWEAIEHAYKDLKDAGMEGQIILVKPETEVFIIGEHDEKILIGTPIPPKKPEL